MSKFLDTFLAADHTPEEIALLDAPYQRRCGPPLPPPILNQIQLDATDDMAFGLGEPL